jgi:hypothetical protein
MKLYYCPQAFSYQDGPVVITVERGAVYGETAAVVKANRECFVPLTVDEDGQVRRDGLGPMECAAYETKAGMRTR